VFAVSGTNTFLVSVLQLYITELFLFPHKSPGQIIIANAAIKSEKKLRGQPPQHVYGLHCSTLCATANNHHGHMTSASSQCLHQTKKAQFIGTSCQQFWRMHDHCCGAEFYIRWPWTYALSAFLHVLAQSPSWAHFWMTPQIVIFMWTSFMDYPTW